MQARVEDDVEDDTPSHTIPGTEDVDEADTFLGTSPDASSDTPSDTILETQDDDEVDTDTDRILDMEASTDSLDEPLPPASELDLVDLHAKVISEADAYQKHAIPKNQDVAKYLLRALNGFAAWADTNFDLHLERFSFLEAYDDPRAYKIVRIMRRELDKISGVINELIDLEIAAEDLAAGCLRSSLIERVMKRCREDITNITLELKDMRHETDSHWAWPGPIPSQNESR